MTSHSTHIASDCDYKNLNVLYRNIEYQIKAFSPFKDGLLSDRENLLLKRYVDATRSEMFFSSAIIYVEGVGEQFIIPSIAKEVYGINLTEHNISVIPIHSRYFDPYLKIAQDGNLEIPVVAIIDGDSDEIEDDEISTTAVSNAKSLEVKERVLVSNGNKTLEIDLFPSPTINADYLKESFKNLGHPKSYNNLIEKTRANPELWESELIKRIDNTIKKGRFAQELSILIEGGELLYGEFIVPDYIKKAIEHIANCKKIPIKC